ncbi:hypothetical protein LCGC14_2478710 [marine sediment metagenome]|uniref:Uncharacterized protein n=1 Tax=marine sediment metagenome TaxID=412755 RepID=A0A0F9E1Z0_9ZZZZ
MVKNISKVKEVYKEIEDVLGSDYITDKDFMKAVYSRNQFFKDMKRTVDPDFLLSPNKFHLHSYDDDISKYIVKDEK